ncbi:uncharacterized protein LOC111711321 [Eurytemora carolleeae]|uniref:uncharacterized protein LOC111711321 n=1 Tax=Eurytemora carolleeae TaxID=1294199 RepID=UPI000C788A8C|nr:uncharacterized protein LOC111711321 [Eurytemora carolleeae]|eukprot:XP_023341421.1 uncharacterized protein LOC111711321 [Eurytemora affinis]
MAEKEIPETEIKMAEKEIPVTVNKNHVDLLQTIPDSWILRECDVYKDEMKSCSSVRGRFQQFYVHGKVSTEGHYSNDVWEKRTTPPEDWNAPLPDWFKEKNDSSYLQLYMDTKEKEAALSSEELQIASIKASMVNAFPSCSIM